MYTCMVYEGYGLSFTERYGSSLPGCRILRSLFDMPSTRRLRSSLTDQLDVRQSQCSTVGDRAFAVAGARLWNSLPHDIVASNTLSVVTFPLWTQNIFIYTVISFYSVLVLYLVVLAVFSRPYLRSRYWYSVASVVVVVVCYVMYCG